MLVGLTSVHHILTDCLALCLKLFIGPRDQVMLELMNKNLLK